MRSRIRIRLKNGRVIEGRYDVARGHPEKPMSWAELADKFRDCAGLVLADKDAETAIQFVARIEELKSLSPLFRALTSARAKSGKKTKSSRIAVKAYSTRRTRRTRS